MSIPKWGELQALSDDELIRRYNSAAEHTVVGTGFYLDELNRRASVRETERMVTLTRAITWLTAAVVVVLTVAVLVLTIMNGGN